MTLIFYGAPMSTATLTELVLEELAIPHERVTIDLTKGDTKKPEFLKLNPNGKVPVLVHDGTVIFESAAIAMYLGETFGVEKKLYPAAGPLRGEAMKWIVWTNVSLGDAVGRYTRNTMDWYPKEQHNAAAGAAGMADILEHLGILDKHLADRAYVLGADYSLADAHLNSFVDWLRHMKLDLAAFPHLVAWGTRCCERPAYKKLWAAAAPTHA